MCEVFGPGKVAKVSKIGPPSLYLWKTKLEEKKSQSNTNSDDKTIKVTRIIANANETSFKEQIIIASIVKNEIELDSPEIKVCNLQFKNKDFFGKNNIHANSELMCLFIAKPSEKTFLAA